MSWGQGVQERSDLPAAFVAFAEQKARKEGITDALDYVTWHDDDDALCHFGGHVFRLSLK